MTLQTKSIEFVENALSGTPFPHPSSISHLLESAEKCSLTQDEERELEGYDLRLQEPAESDIDRQRYINRTHLDAIDAIYCEVVAPVVRSHPEAIFKYSGSPKWSACTTLYWTKVEAKLEELWQGFLQGPRASQDYRVATFALHRFAFVGKRNVALHNPIMTRSFLLDLAQTLTTFDDSIQEVSTI